MTAPSAIRAAKTTTSGKGGADADATAPAKKSKKKLIIIVVVVLLVAGAGYKFMMPAKKAAPGPPVAGEVISMDAMTVNLADGHFLKLQLALQEIKGKGGATLDTAKAADIAVGVFSNRTIATLSAAGSWDTIKAELMKELEKAYPDELMDVYRKQFVMQ
jgi:flagellar FliL protein